MANNSVKGLKEYKKFLNEWKQMFNELPVDESVSRSYQNEKKIMTSMLKSKFPGLVVPSDLLNLESEVAELSYSKGGIPEPTNISINPPKRGGRSRRNRKTRRGSRRA